MPLEGQIPEFMKRISEAATRARMRKAEALRLDALSATADLPAEAIERNRKRATRKSNVPSAQLRNQDLKHGNSSRSVRRLIVRKTNLLKQEPCGRSRKKKDDYIQITKHECSLGAQS